MSTEEVLWVSVTLSATSRMRKCWVMNTRESAKPKEDALRTHWQAGQQTGSCGSHYANVGMRAPLCGGITTQQPSDLAWASSSSSFPLTLVLRSPPACRSVNPSNSNTTQKNLKGKKVNGMGGLYKGTLVFITLNECGWLGGAWHYSLKQCFSHFWYFSCISVEYSLFLPPLGIFTVFCFVLFFCIWIYIYCLDCCWTSLWYQNERKLTKKTPSVLKYCIAIVFNAKYYL